LLGSDRRRVWPALALLALGACSTGESGSWFQFGKKVEVAVDPKMYPDRYKSEVADFMRTYLNNPTKVKDAFIAPPELKQVGREQQYITCVRYNPRNPQNQYEGPRTNLAIFLGGRLNQFLPEDPSMCAGLNYQRFPEIESMVP
jgi:hypothetical protein